MGRTITYANNAQLTSSALTAQDIGNLLQPITLDMLGLPVVDNSQLVRVGWPPEGAPFQDRPQDICYLLATLKPNEDYDRIRYESQAPLSTDPPTIDQKWNYTRTWCIKWIFYGPNALDNSRAVYSALFLDYFTDQLAHQAAFPNSPLYIIYDIQEPARVPELINGQWYDRVDFTCDMSEWVTEHTTLGTVKSVEVHLESIDGEFADLTVTDGT